VNPNKTTTLYKAIELVSERVGGWYIVTINLLPLMELTFPVDFDTMEDAIAYGKEQIDIILSENLNKEQT
jgi:hypothetical protein